MQPIMNIIFDLGGIFIDIDYPKTEKAFKNLGIENFTQLYNQHHASDLFELLETGKIKPSDFYNAFRKTANCKAGDKEIKEAWNALLGQFSKEKLDWLKEIKQRYKIYLFSNTNKIHYDAFINIYYEQTGFRNFDEYFIKAYYSHNLGYRKPYAEAFLKILEEQNLMAAETLFIDDTLKNIEGARQAGLQTIHLVPPQTVLDLKL